MVSALTSNGSFCPQKRGFNGVSIAQACLYITLYVHWHPYDLDISSYPLHYRLNGESEACIDILANNRCNELNTSLFS